MPPGSLLHQLSLPPQSNKIEKAVSAAHTFLQKNPNHEMTLRYLNYYRTMLDVDEYLVDLEAQPYEVTGGQGWGRRGVPGAQCMLSPAEPQGSSSPLLSTACPPPAQKEHLWGPVQGTELPWGELGRLVQLVGRAGLRHLAER